jgi:D-aspartate ligase
VRAAVLLGSAATGVSVARSLARRGITVHALGSGEWDHVAHSRAWTEYIRVEPSHLQAGWFTWLEDSAARLPGAVVLPCGDDGVELIARRRSELQALGYHAFEANDEVSLAMLDKEKTYALAQKAGIPTPRILSMEVESNRAAALSQLGFPLGLKPRQTNVYVRAAVPWKGIVVSSAKEFDSVLIEMDRLGIPMLATEIIPGPPQNLMSYYSYIDSDGRPLFHFTKRKLRQFEPLFGTESYAITHWDARLAGLGSRFFSAIGLRGLAAVEFKLDERDGEFKLIECNHRFTGSHELVRVSGIDLAYLAYERALGRAGPCVDTYRDGVRLWYPLHDVNAFLAMRRDGSLSASDWVRSLIHRQHLHLFQLRDPMPTVADLVLRASLLARRMARREASAPWS